jgi:hypothetical protein
VVFAIENRERDADYWDNIYLNAKDGNKHKLPYNPLNQDSGELGDMRKEFLRQMCRVINDYF